MKKMVALTVLALAYGVFAQQGSLSDARAKIGDAIADPSVMTSVISSLSGSDQKLFLADVNEAIAKMPGSSETKAAQFLDANRAALKGAQKGTLTDLLAEVFATVPLEALTILNENFAADLFNRSANPAVSYTDEQYEKLARDVLTKIAERNAEVDDGAVRTGFAILMFTRASNGSPEGLADKLAEILPEDSREVAKKEWFPAALAEGENKTYDPMLLDTGLLPNEQVVNRLAHARSLETLLEDLATGKIVTENLDTVMGRPYGTDRGGIGAGLDNDIYRVPFYYNRKVYGTLAGQKGTDRPVGGGSKVPGVPGGTPVDPSGRPIGPGGKPIVPEEPPEPHGYDWQK